MLRIGKRDSGMVTPESTMIARETDGRWTKGMSPNPGGRPKGLAGYIRACTDDGQDLVDFVLNVMRGAEIDGDKPGLKLRMQAADWLSNRGFGKPSQFVEFTHREEHPLDDASLDDLQLLLADLQRQRALLEGPNVIEGEARAID